MGKSVWKICVWFQYWLLFLSLAFCMFTFPIPVFLFSFFFLFPPPFGLLVRQPLLPCSLPSLQNKMVKGSLSTEQSERGWGGKCTPGNGNKSKHRWVGESFQFPPALCGSLSPVPSPFLWEIKGLLCIFRKSVMTFFPSCYCPLQASDFTFLYFWNNSFCSWWKAKLVSCYTCLIALSAKPVAEISFRIAVIMSIWIWVVVFFRKS